MTRAMNASGSQNHGTVMQPQVSRCQSYPLSDPRPDARLQQQSCSGEHGHFSCVLIGAGSLLIRCGELWLANEHMVTAVVSSDPTIVAWAQEHGIVVLDQLSELNQLAKIQDFDYLYSVANQRIVPDEVLALPRCAAINFHDSLLPVKLRGYRIELGEIEAALQQAEAVGEAVVVKRDDGAGIPYLAAFLIADQAASAATLPEDWSEFLGHWLPAYMIPTRYVRLQHYPCT